MNRSGGWRYLGAITCAVWVTAGSLGIVEWPNAVAFGFATAVALVLVTEP